MDWIVCNDHYSVLLGDLTYSCIYSYSSGSFSRISILLHSSVNILYINPGFVLVNLYSLVLTL